MSILRVPLVLVVLLCGSACDPSAVFGGADAGPAEPAPDPAKAAADAAAHERAQAKKTADDRFAVCMAGCIEGRAQSPTDRQTCRLTCGADRLEPGGPGPSPSTKAALARWQTCIDDGCPGDASGTDAATCRLNCAQGALAGEAVPTLRGAARGCAVSCLEQVGDCEAACTTKGDADAAATCRLQCTSLGERCLGSCEADPSATPKIPAAPPEPTKERPTSEGDGGASIPERTRAKLPSPP